MNISNTTYKKLNLVVWVLKITYGLLFVVAGADKFTNLVVRWQQYLNPSIAHMVGLEPGVFMYMVGVVEIIIGLLVLSKFTRVGALLIGVWFLIIVLNLLSLKTYFDIAVRDTVLSIGAFCLSYLVAIKDEIS